MNCKEAAHEIGAVIFGQFHLKELWDGYHVEQYKFQFKKGDPENPVILYGKGFIRTLPRLNMDEHGNGLNEEQMAILTDMALEWGGAVDITYRQSGNGEIAINSNGISCQEGGRMVRPSRMLRTIDAWNRVSELHPKGNCKE